MGDPRAGLKYEFFTPYHRGFDLVFDFLREQPNGRFQQGPLSIRASYGYERARDADVFAEEQYVGTAHSLTKRFAALAPAYQHFMGLVETAATAWAADKQAEKDAAELRQREDDAALCEQVLRAQGIEAASAAETPKIGSVHESPVANGDAPNDHRGTDYGRKGSGLDGHAISPLRALRRCEVRP